MRAMPLQADAAVDAAAAGAASPGRWVPSSESPEPPLERRARKRTVEEVVEEEDLPQRLSRLRARAFAVLNGRLLGVPQAPEGRGKDALEVASTSTRGSRTMSPSRASGSENEAQDASGSDGEASDCSEAACGEASHAEAGAGTRCSEGQATRRRALLVPRLLGDVDVDTLPAARMSLSRCERRRHTLHAAHVGRAPPLLYNPPHAKRRQREEEQWVSVKAVWLQKLAEEDATTTPPRTPRGPNVRLLAKKWGPMLERHGVCCFNFLQKDHGIDLEDDCLTASCVAATSTREGARGLGPGVKGLPAVCGGRYHYEVEFLSAGTIVVGWSAATSLPSHFDMQSFGYCSDGTLVRGSRGGRSYGPRFGKAGDVVGVLLDWRRGSTGPRLGFALNGRDLGLAFVLSADTPPLQLHLCQVADGRGGPPLCVRLRGASTEQPLRFPAPAFAPLGSVALLDFCPFSQAVARATALASRRGAPAAARRLIHGSLDVQLPLAHLAQERQADAVAAGKPPKSSVRSPMKGGG